MRALVLALSLLLCMSQSTISLAASTEFTEVQSLSRAVLVEERTAIWCATCAEIDPQLNDVQRSHGPRIAVVGLHINDAFESQASLERIAYQNLNYDKNVSTPTFFVDGEVTAEGYDAWNNVQKRILSQEISRSAPTILNVSYTGEILYETPSYGQLSILIVEHEKIVPVNEDNPGDKIRDRVLVGYTVIDDTGNKTINVGVTNPSELESWSIIFVHEPTSGGEPYGVLELSNRILTQNNDDILFEIIVVTTLLGGLLVYYRDRISIREEE